MQVTSEIDDKDLTNNLGLMIVLGSRILNQCLNITLPLVFRPRFSSFDFVRMLNK